MNNAGPRRVANAAMTVIDRLQIDFKSHEQVMGVAATFLILAEHFGIPAQEIFTATKNLMNGMDGKRPEFAAVMEYVKHEIK
jgi:hypothetical protein